MSAVNAGSVWVAKSGGGHMMFFPGDGTRPVRRTWLEKRSYRARRMRMEEWTSTAPSGRGRKRYGESICTYGADLAGLGGLRQSMKTGETRMVYFAAYHAAVSA